MTSAAALLAGRAVPRREARRLLAHVLGTTIEALLAHPELAIGNETALQFDALVMRRARGEPMAYLLGEQEFYGRLFKVSPAVLIPRPETELLAQLALDRLRSQHVPRVLDLGTGSGCLAITLALEFPAASVVAVDRSIDALAIARGNADHLGASVDCRQGDWFDAVDGNFDFIVANPPYVAAGDEHLPALHHEPRSALVGGADGLAELRRIIAGAPARLRRRGALAVEHGHDQAAAVRQLFASAGFDEVETHRDASGIDRVCVGIVGEARACNEAPTMQRQ